jgi:peptidoglycan/xylan/chitin deacetylase (PgdA/CDA1 family)
MTRSCVTISVDDGHPTDFRSAELLSRIGLKGTFYIPKGNPERQVMPEADIKALSNEFEIGAHTLSHLALHRMPDAQALQEIAGSKEWLEDLLGVPCRSFCYPRGKFNASTPALVRSTGLLGARTCLFNRTEWPRDPFLAGVSSHAFPHSRVRQIRMALRERNGKGLWDYFWRFRMAADWAEHFLKAAVFVEETGGVAHLYYHSWEIDALGQWQKLEDVLREIKSLALQPITNGDCFELVRRGRGSL